MTPISRIALSLRSKSEKLMGNYRGPKGMGFVCLIYDKRITARVSGRRVERLSFDQKNHRHILVPADHYLLSIYVCVLMSFTRWAKFIYALSRRIKPYKFKKKKNAFLLAVKYFEKPWNVHGGKLSILINITFLYVIFTFKSKKLFGYKNKKYISKLFVNKTVHS